MKIEIFSVLCNDGCVYNIFVFEFQVTLPPKIASWEWSFLVEIRVGRESWAYYLQRYVI